MLPHKTNLNTVYAPTCREWHFKLGYQQSCFCGLTCDEVQKNHDPMKNVLSLTSSCVFCRVGVGWLHCFTRTHAVSAVTVDFSG